jgi:hypothetical protein
MCDGAPSEIFRTNFHSESVLHVSEARKRDESAYLCLRNVCDFADKDNDSTDKAAAAKTHTF